MPGRRCAVAGCNNSFLKSKKEGSNISFHSFPTDGNRRNVWIKACGRENDWNPNTSAICSDHFQTDDFERDFRGILMNIKTKRQLKPIAIPSLQLKSNKLPPSSRKREKRTKSGIVSEILQESTDVECNELLQQRSSRGRRREKRTKVPCIGENESLEDKYNDLLQKYNSLAKTNESQEQSVARQCLTKNVQDIKKVTWHGEDI